MASSALLNFDKLTKALQDLSISFFDKANKSKYRDYIGYEALFEEITKLNIPIDSEILNPAAGPGILSAQLQIRGYHNLDAMDHSMETIRKLRKIGLYRNYICRPVEGLNSTGVKEETYDAIIMAGGFSPDNIRPRGLNEFLRITKPDGHILFTLREDYHHSTSDFALLEENLEDLELAGKIKVMKRGEIFTDAHSGLSGRLYVLIKTVSEREFEPHVPRTLPTLVIDSVKDHSHDNDENQPYYDEWSDRSEDDNMVMVGRYTGAVKLCEAFFKLRLDKNTTEILDVSVQMANPGLVGHQLTMNGFQMVDGIDNDIENLNLARGRKLYRNYILGRVAELGSIPVNDESYDVVLMAGGFAPRKVQPAAFHELIRVLRPGGYILWTMRDGYGQSDQEFALFDVRIQDLIKDRKWELLVGPVFFENFALHHPGRFYMLRKCHREIFALGSPRHSPRSSPMMRRKKPVLGANKLTVN